MSAVEGLRVSLVSKAWGLGYCRIVKIIRVSFRSLGFRVGTPVATACENLTTIAGDGQKGWKEVLLPHA